MGLRRDATPKKLDLHLIADNYATHKHPKVKAWLAKHPRFHMHFTPTSASWLSQVERFFGLITSDQIRCGVFKSRRTRNSHSGIPRAPQCRSKTLRMDRFRHRHTAWATGVRVGTLEGVHKEHAIFCHVRLIHALAAHGNTDLMAPDNSSASLEDYLQPRRQISAMASPAVASSSHDTRTPNSPVAPLSRMTVVRDTS